MTKEVVVSIKRIFFAIVSAISLPFLLESICHARLDTVPGSRYTAARAAGMGDAYLTLPEDGISALFYNPALLADIQGVHFEPTNLQLGTNTDYYQTVGLTGFYKGYFLPLMVPTLKLFEGQRPALMTGFSPSFYFRGFAIGMLNQMELSSVYRAGVVNYQSNYEMTPAAGASFSLARGIIRFGYSALYVNKVAGKGSLRSDDSAMSYAEAVYKGSGLSHNAAWTMTLPITFLPSFAVVARNLGNLKYSTTSIVPLGTNTLGAPKTELMSVDAGFSIQPKVFQGAFANLAFQLRDATETSGLPLYSRTSIGSEFSLRQGLVNLRAGVGSGYPAAGIGFHTLLGDLNVAWYSEELGTSYHSERDMKFSLQYQKRAF